MNDDSAFAEASFQRLMDAAPVMIWVSGPDRLCLWFNKPWLEFTGRTIEQERGNGWTEGVHPDDLDRCLEIYTAHFDKRLPFRMDYRLRRADGEYRWILDTGVPRTDTDGTFLGYIGSCVDITAIKQVKLGLKQTVTSREVALDALDRVATTMAHEFRNILMSVQLFHGAIRGAAGDPTAVVDLVDQAETAVDEGDAIIRGLLDAVRRPTNPEAIHINQMIAESRAILRGAAGAKATLVVQNLVAQPDKVIVDPAQFCAALLNLVSNARDAMPEGGTITISTRSMTIRPETLDEADLAPGRYIVVTVSDTGIGMDESLTQRAFEPFFTTKGAQGTGIGLYQVRRLVRNIGGVERVESAAGKGTTIRLYFPEAAAERLSEHRLPA